MSILPLHADARAGAREAARSDFLERRLARFQPAVQPRLRAVAAQHPRLKDLAASFPALLFALAVPRAGYDRARVCEAVISGAPLRELATMARVPLWLRSLPPHSFRSALPSLPDGELFRRQIGNFLPLPSACETWMQSVAGAQVWADEAVALWIARELKQRPKLVMLNRLRGVCVWAWHSRNVALEGVTSIKKQWSPVMQFDQAADAAMHWYRSVDLYLRLGSEPVVDMWLTPGTVDGYEFVPLRSATEIVEEAHAMKHCVIDYGRNIQQRVSRLWSVRLLGRRVATLEVGYPCGDPLPSIAQICGVQNARVGTEVWLVARRWLNSHDPLAISRASLNWECALYDRRRWTGLWRQFWLAKQIIPDWLPLWPSQGHLSMLQYGDRRPRAPHRVRRRRGFR